MPFVNGISYDSDDAGEIVIATPGPSAARSQPLQHPAIAHVNNDRFTSMHMHTQMDMDEDEDEDADVDEGEGDEYSDSTATVEVDELDESEHSDSPVKSKRSLPHPRRRTPPGLIEARRERAAAAAGGSGSGAASVPSSVAPAKPAPVVKKPRSKPPTIRIPGQTIVPMSRVEAILNGDAGQHGAHSKEATFLISLATEEFIRVLALVANARSRVDKRSLTTYNDIADAAFHFEEYHFLREIIPRPMSPRNALGKRRRIIEEQEALLHGVGVEGADSSHAIKIKLEQTSVSTSNASTPVPRLSKPVPAPNAGASANGNGKMTFSSRTKNAATKPATRTKINTPMVIPIIRSERQKQKKARESQASAASEPSASGHMPPPPSPAPEEGGKRQEGAPAVNGSSSGMKIKIRPRHFNAPDSGSAAPNNSPTPPPILPLGPPSTSKPRTHAKRSYPYPRENHETIRRASKVYASRKDKEADSPPPPLVFERDEKSTNGARDYNNSANGNGRPVQFAPVGVDASDQPLWTRTPLPARVSSSSSTRSD